MDRLVFLGIHMACRMLFLWKHVYDSTSWSLARAVEVSLRSAWIDSMGRLVLYGRFVSVLVAVYADHAL